MSTYILRLDPPDGDGPRLAVKDLLDVAGVPTTGGSKAYVESGRGSIPEFDAVAVARCRKAGARIVGKANLHELAYGARGVNPWYGTPTNPFVAHLVPGGSSSGSAVAVAEGSADIALGTDTGGSVRIPAACCGVVGLKTTWGRIPLEGCLKLAPSLDTIGPLARDVAGVAQGMAMLEPGFVPGAESPRTVGRIRLPAGFESDPSIDAAVDAALAATGWTVVDIALRDWAEADAASRVVSGTEAALELGWLLDQHRAGLGADVVKRVTDSRRIPAERVPWATAVRHAWRTELAGLFGRFTLLALPTLKLFPPSVEAPEEVHWQLSQLTRPFNLAGCPALSLPVPTAGSAIPASLQLAAAWGGEDVLCAAGAVVEAAVA